MKKLFLINVSANSGSTGRIAEEIGQTAMQHGYESYFAYGRTGRDSKSHLIRIGNDFDIKIHGIESRLFDNHGFSSRRATRKLIEEIERIRPDVINLHNVHGYYLNVEILFNYLTTRQIPVVWTLHDCWPFTGHCSYFDRFHCEKWKTVCHDCPNKKGYPTSLFLDRSSANYKRKKELFNKLENLTFVPVCRWMEQNVRASFLSRYNVETIYNGVDVGVFKPIESLSLREKYGVNGNKKVVLGVASVWDKRKGLDDFVALSPMLGDDYQIILVGLNEEQLRFIPKNVMGIKRTESIQELAELYNLADVFVNPTYVDNFPTTNIEALACGTPVVTYNTGGSPEVVDEKTGIVVEQGNIQQLKSAIGNMSSHKEACSAECRKRAEMCFDKKDRFEDYVGLFDRVCGNY